MWVSVFRSKIKIVDVLTLFFSRVTGLKIELLGETSIASTISYLDNAVVFIGSSYGDSQVPRIEYGSHYKIFYIYFSWIMYIIG